MPEQNKQYRVIFSLNYIYRNLQFCKQVIFTDDKIQGSMKNTCNVLKNLEVLVWMYGDGSTVMEWTYVGKSMHVLMLKISCGYWIMWCCLQQLYPNNNFIYQQNNCSVHTAFVMREWFQNRNIDVLPSPAICKGNFRVLFRFVANGTITHTIYSS